NLRDSSPRRVLISNGPARSFAGIPQFLLQRRALDFDHDAVDLIRQTLPLAFPMLDESPDFLHVRGELAVEIGFEADFLQDIDRVPVTIAIGAALLVLHVAEVVDRSACGDAVRDLATDTGSRGPMIGK